VIYGHESDPEYQQTIDSNKMGRSRQQLRCQGKCRADAHGLTFPANIYRSITGDWIFGNVSSSAVARGNHDVVKYKSPSWGVY
jgi:hypothetical protein